MNDSLFYLNNVTVKDLNPPKTTNDEKEKTEVKKDEKAVPKELRFNVTSSGTKIEDVMSWRHVPVVLFGRDYWQRIINFEAMAAEGVINTEDLSLIDYAESAEDGWRIIREFHRRTCED